MLANLAEKWTAFCEYNHWFKTLGTTAGDLGTRLIGLLITVWLAATLSAWTIRDNSPQLSDNRAVSVSITNYVQRSPLSSLCLHKKLLPHPPYIYSPTPSHPPRFFILLMLILGGDVEINSGPGAKSTSPCGYCELAVNWSQKGICCDCSLWFHKTCVDISSGEYDRLSNITVDWKCFRCNTTNSSCRFHSYELNVYNPFETLSYSPLCDQSVPLIPHLYHLCTVVHNCTLAQHPHTCNRRVHLLDLVDPPQAHYMGHPCQVRNTTCAHLLSMQTVYPTSGLFLRT